MATTVSADPLVIAGVELRSRLFLGTGKYRTDEEMVAALEASGAELITVALRRLGGTWVAWGSGDGDREAVLPGDIVKVPPESPEYRLRRVWLTPEDVKAIAYDVLRHRVSLTYEAEAENLTSEKIVQRILEKIEVP